MIESLEKHFSPRLNFNLTIAKNTNLGLSKLLFLM